MSFGNDVIVFRHLVRSGVADEMGVYQMTTVDTPAPGCRHRPLTPKEAIDLQFDVNTQYWRSTLPLKDYDAALLAVITEAQGNDIISVNGRSYQIVGGVQPFGDMASVPFKMTIISKRQDSQED